ncbi:hypothetical protein MY11210_006270 [Beauveria gryllotalpidicola]
MASLFRLPPEMFSDDDLARGFSFDARQANKQGQFSGLVPKNIVPCLQSADQTASAPPAMSPKHRFGIPFPVGDFTSNLQREAAKALCPSPRANDQAEGSANGNLSTSSHFSHGSNQDEPVPVDVIQSTKILSDAPQKSVATDTESCSPPSRRCDDQSLDPSPMDRQGRPLPSFKNASNTSETIVRSKDRSQGRKRIQRDDADSRTPPICGDLEGFGIYEASNVTRTPTSQVKMILGSQSRTHSVDIESSIARRTHSRASNMSRKRPRGLTDHEAHEPDRKRLAMTKAVKHWNECIQLTTEESDRARSTIHSLKKKLQCQANELQIAQDALQTGGTSLRTLQKQYKDLEEKDIRASKDKKDLEAKFKELNVDYGKLQNQIREMSIKYNSCEEKLNMAISEQRDLFNKSKDFYNDLNDKMKQDEARGKGDAEAVEEALQSSKQKREELKNVVDKIKRVSERQKMEYEHKIRSLEEENEAQCDQIVAIEEDKMRYYNEMVSNRSTKACIDNLSSQLPGFVTQLRALDASQDTAAIELRSVKTRVDNLPNSRDFSDLKQQVSGSHARLGDLEKLIQESLLPAVEGIASKQSESQTSVNSLALAVEGGFTKLQEHIQKRAIDLGKTIRDSNKSHAELVNLLTLISAGNGDVSSRVEAVSSRLESLVEQTSPQGIIGTSIASILASTQCLAENSDKIGFAQEKAQEEAQRLHEALTGQMDAKFLHHEAVSHNLLNGLKESFNVSLARLKTNLTPESGQRANGGKSAQINGKMLKDIETMRSNLQHVESQLSKIDDVPLSLQKIYDLSVLIQKTSKYMGKEEQWVQQTMADRQMHSDGSGTTDNSDCQISSSQSSTLPSTESGIGCQESPSDEACESQTRKVVVHSPRPQGYSPLPVTTAQEQRRRRESARPRSILKQSQHNHFAVKSLAASARSSFHTSEEVIADIRSVLVQSPPSGSPSSHRITGLTPITEYLRLNKVANRSMGVVLGDLADAELASGHTVTTAGITATI